MPSNGFAELRVLSLESRKAPEMAKLISNCGGVPMVAPSMREVPLESNRPALAFASALVEGRLDIVIFLTGVGMRTLSRVVETVVSKEQFVAALSRVPVVARGSKSVAALKELGVPIRLAVPEPNTWRELLQMLDDHADTLPVRGRRVAVQEYGETNAELVAGLEERGAVVVSVPVYEWMLPEDTTPLRAAILALTRSEVDIALFTSAVQVRHLLQVAEEMGVEPEVRRAFNRIVVASIGPITSQELVRYGLVVDFEPSHPKMGFLVQEASDHSASLVARKRSLVS